MVNADGTGRTRLTKGSYTDDRHPAWSPNGKKIAFGRNANVFVMNPAPESATNRPRQVTDYGRFYSSASGLDWQPIPQ